MHGGHTGIERGYIETTALYARKFPAYRSSAYRKSRKYGGRTEAGNDLRLAWSMSVMAMFQQLSMNSSRLLAEASGPLDF